MLLSAGIVHPHPEQGSGPIWDRPACMHPAHKERALYRLPGLHKLIPMRSLYCTCEAELLARFKAAQLNLLQNLHNSYRCLRHSVSY